MDTYVIGIYYGTDSVRSVIVDAISGNEVAFFFQAEDGIRDLTVTEVQTCALPIFASLTPGKGLLTVDWHGGGSDPFHYVWLRDNCPCPECLHPSGQRLVDILDLPADAAPRKVTLDEAGALLIRWDADGHESRYPADWLRRHAYGPQARAARRRQPILWEARLKPLPEADWPAVSKDPAAE